MNDKELEAIKYCLEVIEELGWAAASGAGWDRESIAKNDADEIVQYSNSIKTIITNIHNGVVNDEEVLNAE